MITSERLVLRQWRDSDKALFAALNADPEVMAHLGGPQSREESDAALGRQVALIDQGEPAFWAAERLADGAFLGFVGIKRISFEAPFGPGYEIGWRLAREHWGHGYASEGARAALAHGFTRLDLPRIFSFTVPPNTASQAVMQRIGMTRMADGDFNHPLLPPDHPLSRHVLYKIERTDWACSTGAAPQGHAGSR